MSQAYSPQEFGAKVQAIIAALSSALHTGVGKAVTLVNNAAIANLSGSRKAEPWTYPVPIRTPGGLRANQHSEMTTPLSGVVFNTSAYAGAIHGGNVSEWAGRGKHRMTQRLARPFQDDAVNTAQPLMVIQTEVQGALSAWA
ncbi:hypothetical protein HFP05_03400 [Rhodanobacter denitrificans]|nr:hypothetical protein [Rhodanobacter denitrificans]